MRVKDIQGIIEAWAPPEIAWERDNVGLQVGDAEAEVRGVLVCLDVTPAIALEARKRRANLIVSHHPLLFRPLHAVTPVSHAGALVIALLKEGVSLYSAHTNLDSARGGTSFALARALQLRDIDFLLKSCEIARKIVTFVPAEHVDRVAAAMSGAGAGIIGNYGECSFRVEGTGTFRGDASSHPSVGTKGRLERVPETRLEMVAPRWQVGAVVKALKSTHPYEEVAYDIYPMENRSNGFGMGIIGTLPRPVRLSNFLAMIKRSLSAKMVRFVAGKGQTVQRIAACGGGGAELLAEAVRQGADAFVTGDVKYHTFAEAQGTIALVDAGHFETEFPLVPALVARLQNEIRKRGERVRVFGARLSENPVLCA